MDAEGAFLWRTPWSDSVCHASRDACQHGIKLRAVIVPLGQAAKERKEFRDCENGASPEIPISCYQRKNLFRTTYFGKVDHNVA